MYNILIVDDNIFFVKKLINIICDKIKSIRLHSVATNGKEALEKLQSNEIDIVLLDLKIPNIDGLEILNSLNVEQEHKYENSIILVSGEPELIAKAYGNRMVHGYVHKGSDINILINEINQLIEEKIKRDEENKLIKRIIEEEQYLGYNPSYKGTKYLVECIIYMAIRDTDNLDKEIYPILAKKYNKSVSNIKCNIARATDVMYYECEKDKLNKYFNFYSDYKPKPKVVMSTILRKVM